MSLPYNKTNIITNALIYLGYPKFQSIAAAGPAGEAIDAIYDSVKYADLSSPNWRFATKVVQLSQLAGVNPGFEWYNSAYQIPPDCLAVWQIYPTLPYEIYGEQIWTANGPNQPLKMQYRHWPVPESMLPPAYLQYLSYLIAHEVGPGLIKDSNLLKDIESRMTNWRAKAMCVNTQGRPNEGLINSSWVNSRPAGSFYGTMWNT